MTTLYGSKGIIRDTRPQLRILEPEIYAVEYPTILTNVAKTVTQTAPEDLDIATTHRFLDLKQNDTKAVRTLIESNNLKQYAIGVKELTYIPQLYKITNTVDSFRNQVNVDQALQVAVRYLTMQHDSFALFDNHNKSFLSDTTTITGNGDITTQLGQLVTAYQQYNDEAPIIFIGYGALTKLNSPLPTSTAGGYAYGNAMAYLKEIYEGSVENKRVVNQYVLNNIDEGASSIGSTVKFGTNDIVFLNPIFTHLYLGVDPLSINNYAIGDESITHHYFSTPSLQMVSKDRSYRLTLA